MHPADKESSSQGIAPMSAKGALAEHLLELSQAPLVAVDGAAAVSICNSSFAELLARSRSDIRGRSLWDLLATGTAEDSRLEMERQWHAVLDGATDVLRLPLQRTNATALLMTLRCDRLEQDGAALVLARVVEHEILLPKDKREARQFEVGVHERNRHHLRTSATAASNSTRGNPCYTELHGRSAVCLGCPIFDGGNREKVAAGQRKWVLPPQGAEPGSYCVVSFEPSEAGWVRVTEVQLDDGALSGLFRARLQRLGRQAQLTEREREVLELVCLGRAVEDVAIALGVTVHTVKFHQANMLKKLGVDSRLDIMRLML